MHERQTLKNKPILRIKPFPLNPLNFSPLTTNTKMDEEIQRQIWDEFLPKVCISHRMSEVICTYPCMNVWRISNHIEYHRLQINNKDNKLQWKKKAIK
jgi:hypothetical protein